MNSTPGLRILNNTDLRRPDHTPIQHIPWRLCMEYDPILLVRLWCHEDRIVHIWIEFRLLGRRIVFGQAVLLEDVQQDRLHELHALVQVDQVRVGRFLLRSGKTVGGHGVEGVREVVDGGKEVAGEFLEGEVMRLLAVSCRSVLQIAVVGYRADVAVLFGKSYQYIVFLIKDTSS